ncbi:MAG: cation diffusion facilitator family transporter [Candidatus Altiarchaeota archaeon]|nr:cation diffusion facilitator family transporter [Candidatus Altiarchaeota archaeon]
MNSGKDPLTSRANDALHVTWVGLFVNIALSAFKLTAGILGRSAAMIADAVHSISDLATDLVVLVGFRYVKKPVDVGHDYGHGKYETLASLVVGVILFGAGLTILLSGVRQIAGAAGNHEVVQPGWIAFYAALISIVSKELLYQYTIKVGRKIDSSAVVANAWHHRSDALSSVGTLIGVGGAIMLGSNWRVLDPLAAFFVSLMILKTAYDIVRENLGELLEASLCNETEDRIMKIAGDTPGVHIPHNLRTRKIGSAVAIDLHVKVDPRLNVVKAHEIATDIEKRLKDSFGRQTFISIHVEPLSRSMK